MKIHAHRKGNCCSENEVSHVRNLLFASGKVHQFNDTGQVFDLKFLERSYMFRPEIQKIKICPICHFRLLFTGFLNKMAGDFTGH
jgi:hypothetical protein